MSWSWQTDYIFDFDLGYVRAGCSLSGIDVIGKDCGRKILVLGGCVDANSARSGKSWPHFLEQILRDSGNPAQILSGDTKGYVSGQELIMLIRDGILLEPAHVVVMSGANNFHEHAGFDLDRRIAGIVRAHPFIGATQAKIVGDVTSVLGIEQGGIYYGVPDSTPPAELWLEHMTIMRNLCLDHGIVFTSFLQPDVLAIPDDLSDAEMEYLRLIYNASETFVREAHAAVRRIYTQVRALIRDKNWIVDFSARRDAIFPSLGRSVKAQREHLAEIVALHLAVQAGTDAAVPKE